METMEMLRVSQAARQLGCSEQNIRDLCRKGRLRHIWTPFGRLIDPAAVRELQQQRQGSKGAGRP